MCNIPSERSISMYKIQNAYCLMSTVLYEIIGLIFAYRMVKVKPMKITKHLSYSQPKNKQKSLIKHQVKLQYFTFFNDTFFCCGRRDPDFTLHWYQSTTYMALRALRLGRTSLLMLVGETESTGCFTEPWLKRQNLDET